MGNPQVVTGLSEADVGGLERDASNALQQFLKSNDPSQLKRAQVAIETLEVINRRRRNEQAAVAQRWSMVRAITSDPEKLQQYVKATQPHVAEAVGDSRDLAAKSHAQQIAAEAEDRFAAERAKVGR